MSCPQIWNIEKEKDRENENVGDRLAKLNEKKSDRELEREIKNDEAEFRWNNNMKILYLPVAASKVKMSGREKQNANRKKGNNGK